jgi:molybdopterin-containing oxidoreductase family membrane subunit
MKNLNYSAVNQQVMQAMFPPGKAYGTIVAFWFMGILVGLGCWAYQIFMGLGVAGVNHPIAWGTYLVNFVFFVGLAHSGTLISAILFLFRARWRTPISRSAEAMTVFAVMAAGLFPFIHLGRIWVVYWILPYPNQRNLWPDFQSPLVFDVIAISTYLLVSILFWYTGLIPDLAAVRDRSQGLRRKIYGFFSLNWTGSQRQWRHHGGGASFSWLPWPPRWSFPCTALFPGISPCPYYRGGTAPSSPPILWPGPSIPVWPWSCSC